jgi:hypothetical protein
MHRSEDNIEMIFMEIGHEAVGWRHWIRYRFVAGCWGCGDEHSSSRNGGVFVSWLDERMVCFQSIDTAPLCLLNSTLLWYCSYLLTAVQLSLNLSSKPLRASIVTSVLCRPSNKFLQR